jgi:peroxin-6
LVALTTASYELTCVNSSLFEDWFCTGEPILRQYTTYTFAKDTTQATDPFQFHILMVEPVLQGYASVGNTKFFVSMQGDQNNSWIHSSDRRSTSEPGIDSDKEGIEIDESFLAGSVLHTMSNPSPAASPRASVSEDVSGVLPNCSGDSPLASLTELLFSCESWYGPTLPSAEDHTVHIRTFDLGRTGLLDGDWVRSSVSQVA